MEEYCIQEMSDDRCRWLRHGKDTFDDKGMCEAELELLKKLYGDDAHLLRMASRPVGEWKACV